MGQSVAGSPLKTHRVYVDPPLQEGQKLALDITVSHHLLRVLRLQVGNVIVVCDGQGNDYRATLLPPRGQGKHLQVWVELGSSQPNQAQARRAVHLGVAPISGERFERMLEQLAELGVLSVTPLFTERSNVRNVSEPKLQRWRRVATEASLLAGRGSPLRIHPSQRLAQFLQGRQGVLLHQEAPPWQGPASGESCLAIGPEGGFTDHEVGVASQLGWPTASLGQSNLRVETAAVVGAVLALY